MTSSSIDIRCVSAIEGRALHVFLFLFFILFSKEETYWQRGRTNATHLPCSEHPKTKTALNERKKNRSK